MDTKLKIEEGQDLKNTNPNHTKVRMHLLVPKEEVVTAAQIKNKIELEEQEISNMELQIHQSKTRIAELKKLLEDINKLLSS